MANVLYVLTTVGAVATVAVVALVWLEMRK